MNALEQAINTKVLSPSWECDSRSVYQQNSSIYTTLRALRRRRWILSRAAGKLGKLLELREGAEQDKTAKPQAI